jgi:septal ring factor EnvC (AmiA/AmiB activator)
MTGRVQVAATALAVLAAPPLFAQANLDRNIRDNQARLDSIRDERQRLQTELEQLRGRVHNISAELENIESQRSITSRIVNELDRQMSSMGSQLDTITIDLMLAQDALSEKRAVLQRRLTQIYKRGSLHAFEVLLAAESFGDLLSRYKYLYLVSRQDQALVQEVEHLSDRIDQQRRDLLTVQNTFLAQRRQRGQELDRYVRLERRSQQSLRQTLASQRTTSSQVDSLARAEESVNRIVATLERERRRRIAAGTLNEGAGAIGTEDLGSLDWPVEGTVKYRFGPAPGPDGTRLRRDGIGIAAPQGTPVRAVASGAVEIAGPMETWGPTVFIDHGNGYYTLYLYLSALRTTAGQIVTAGQVIGLSGGSSTAEGPHIEFQIRQAAPGSDRPLALDPENWLKPRR